MDGSDRAEAGVGIYTRWAFSIWLLAGLVIGLLAYFAPRDHTVTSVYHTAVANWLAEEPLYRKYSFHYPPQFVFIFIPFYFIPSPAGDILWRLASIALFFWGFKRLINLSPYLKDGLFFLAAMISLLSGLAAMRNGQANVLFAALMLHAAAGLALSQWLLAAVCLVTALAVKGAIGLVMLLLAALAYRELGWRLLPGLFLFSVVPFFFHDPSYVASQYRQYLEHLTELSVNQRHFADLGELLRRLGIAERTPVLLSLAAGFAVLFFWRVGAGRKDEPERAWLLLGLTATYLMLFNPMTEINSYVIAGPALAIYSVRFIAIRGYEKLGYALAFMGLSLGLFHEIFRSADKDFGLLWGPVVMLAFGAVLGYSIFLQEPAKKS